MSWTARIASLVPGRAHGELERDPARSAGDKVLLLRQDQLGEIAVRPAGVVLMEAGPFSHALIQWLGREVPTGLVEADQTIQWKDREPVLLDSARGEVRPLAAEETPAPWSAPAAPTPGEPIATRDGISVRLTASVGGAPGARRAVVAGAAAIGLVRSEYLLPDDGAMPSAAFYRSSLSALLEAAAPLEVTVRLLDLGADKWPPWVSRGRHGAGLQACTAVGSTPTRPCAGWWMRSSPRSGTLEPQAGLACFGRRGDDSTSSCAGVTGRGQHCHRQCRSVQW